MRAFAPLRIAMLAAVMVCTPRSGAASMNGDGTLLGGGRERAQSFRGHVVPWREASLRPPADEIVDIILVEEGDVVRTGQLLGFLDDRVQSAVVELARQRADNDAVVRRTALEQEDAEKHLQRVVRAHDRGAATDRELDKAWLAADRAAAVRAEAIEAREVARAALELELRRLERYTLVAPFGGVILEITAESGEMHTTEEPLLVVASLDKLEAHINLPARHYGALKVGEQYLLAAAEPVNRDLVGTLVSIDVVIDAASQSFRANFSIENEDRELPAGFAVNLAWPPGRPMPESSESADAPGSLIADVPTAPEPESD